jgi:hypothetical protein
MGIYQQPRRGGKQIRVQWDGNIMKKQEILKEKIQGKVLRFESQNLTL